MPASGLTPPSAVPQRQEPPNARPPPPPPHDDRPVKRVKFEDGTPGSAPSTVSPEAVRQLKAALKRIRTHIGAASKAAKASELMRKLLDDGSICAEVVEQAFQVLCEAMASPDRADDVELRRPLRKLILAAEAEEQCFSKAMRRHLDVWKVWAVLRPQLHTDDSFVFTKVANNVRDLVAELPEIEPEEEDAFAAIRSGEWDAQRRARCQEMDEEDAAEGAAAPSQPPPDAPTAEAAAADESDPFGLDAFMERVEKESAAQTPARAQVRGLVWSATQCRVMRRQALLDCLTTMTAICKHPWARSSAFQAIEAAWRRRELFCEGQQPQVQSLHDFVQKTRATVLKGPTAGQVKQDANAFEQARKEWSTKAVSSRGKVGAAGDAKASGWLG